MGKQPTRNDFPGITKELGIVHRFPSPSCGSYILSQWSGGLEFIPIPLHSPEKEDQGFKNFLLAYCSGFYVIYHLRNSQFYCQQKKSERYHGKKCYIGFLRFFLPVIMMLFPPAQIKRTDPH